MHNLSYRLRNHIDDVIGYVTARVTQHYLISRRSSVVLCRQNTCGSWEIREVAPPWRGHVIVLRTPVCESVRDRVVCAELIARL